MSETVTPSPFWRFSLAFYGTPGVGASCIALQDAADVDVNILLFVLWNASLGRVLDIKDIAIIEARLGPWREMAVVPVRAVRRALKTPPAAIPAATAEAFRNRVKAVELEAERLQQEALYALSQAGPLGHPAKTSVEAARAGVEAYESLLRPFPPRARDDLIAAFATFTTPAPNAARTADSAGGRDQPE